MGKSFEERRKYLRIYRNFILSYHEKGKSTPPVYVSQVKNISKGGLSFTSTFSLKEGIVVIIDLKTPFLADSIRLEGLVLECREKVPELIYQIRLEFQGVTEQVLAVLDKIEKYGKEK